MRIDTCRLPRLSADGLLPESGSVDIPSPVEVGLFGPAPLVGVALIGGWVTAGLLTAVALSRHGHDLRSTGALGLVFGPLFIPFARELRKNEEEAKPVLVAPGRTREGPVDVLVNLRCPPAGAASVLPVLQLLGHRLGRVTLVRVLDFESMQDDEERASAELQLSCASLFLGEYEPSLLLLPGHSMHAAREHAAAEGFDALIVVGGSQRVAPRKGSRPSGAGKPEPPVLVVADSPRHERRG